MKKLLAFLICVSVVVAGFSVMAAREVSVVFDGEKMSFDVNPYIDNDRTLVPMRAIFEKAGATITWDGDSRTVIAAYKVGDAQKFVILQIDNQNAFVDGEKKTLDVPAKIVNDRTFVPLRFVMEELGSEVTWDPDTYTVNIKSK